MSIKMLIWMVKLNNRNPNKDFTKFANFSNNSRHNEEKPNEYFIINFSLFNIKKSSSKHTSCIFLPKDLILHRSVLNLLPIHIQFFCSYWRFLMSSCNVVLALFWYFAWACLTWKTFSDNRFVVPWTILLSHTFPKGWWETYSRLHKKI